MTAYTEVYRRWELSKREPIRPRDNLRVGGPKFDATTSYQDDFGLKSFTGLPSTYCKVPETRPVKGASAYETGYTPPAVQPSGQQRVPYKPNSVPFSGDSSYAHTYRIPQAEWVRPKASGESALRFFGDSPQSKSEVPSRPEPPERQQKQIAGYSQPKGEMHFITTYNWDFRAWEIEKRVPILPRDQITKPTGPFMHTTSYLAEYTPKMTMPAQSQRSSRR